MAVEQEFLKLLKEFKENLSLFKKKCDAQENKSGSSHLTFIKSNKSKIYKVLDNYFRKLWEILERLDENQKKEYQDVLIAELDPYFHDSIEIVTYIRARPLGYAGDFVTMNYIYDFNKKSFLGKSLYEKLLNHYTCSIRVSCSNIARKDYLKKRILGVLNKNKEIKILSVGSGPARELIELISEKKIKYPVEFNCLDFERKAIDFVKDRISHLKPEMHIKVNFFPKDLLEVVKNKALINEFRDTDLIYISGVFDYFTDRLCKRTIANLIPLLAAKGNLIIFNMSLENASHRAYYETLAKWEMRHRTVSDLKGWVEDIGPQYKSKIVDIRSCPGYHIMNITRE